MEGRKPLRLAPAGSPDDAWKKYFEVAEKWDNAMCKTLHLQIDTVLVFAGLFSAVVTAFTVESYQWLYHDSGDATVELLIAIADMVAQDRGRANVSAPNPSPVTDSQAAIINTIWFLALLLSLSSAFVAILAKQWISKYEDRYRQSYRDGLAVRQARYEGMETWRVEGIATSLPLLLLQAALALFVVGILELLWALDNRVAVPAIIVSSVLTAFYLATSLMPALQLLRWHARRGSTGVLRTQTPSPYKSPQAWLALRALAYAIWCIARFRKALKAVRRAISRSNRHLSRWIGIKEGPKERPRRRSLRPLLGAKSWILFDYQWVSLSEAHPTHAHHRRAGVAVDHAYDALAWLLARYDLSELASALWHCLWPCVTARGEDRDPPPQHDPTTSSERILTLDAADHHFDRMARVLARVALPVDTRIDRETTSDLPLRRLILMINYSVAAEAAPGLIFELLLLAQQTALALLQDRISGLPDSLSPYSMQTLVQGAAARCSAQNIDDATCAYLVAVLSQSELWGAGYEFKAALRAALPVLSMGPMVSERRKELMLGICAAARSWLHSYQDTLLSSQDILDFYEILIEISHLLGIRNAEDLAIATQSTRVMSALAVALGDAWRIRDRPMQLEAYILSTSPASAEIFFHLVGAASLSPESNGTTPPPVILEHLLQDDQDLDPDDESGTERQIDAASNLTVAPSSSVDAQSPVDVRGSPMHGIYPAHAQDIAPARAPVPPLNDVHISRGEQPSAS